MFEITVVLLDLDGVVRHFDDDLLDRIALEHGLTVDQMVTAAFETDDYRSVVTGGLSRKQWVIEVGELLGNPEAAAEWLADRGVPDPRMLAIVEELKRRGLDVAVLTNGTEALDIELRKLDLIDRFDVIFNTAEIGYAKPDERAFRHVCERLDVDPSAVFFTDDLQLNVDAATAMGMTTHYFDGVDGFLEALTRAGIDLSDTGI